MFSDAGSTPAASTIWLTNYFKYLSCYTDTNFGHCDQNCAYLCPIFGWWIPHTTSQKRCRRVGSNSECSGRRFCTTSRCPHAHLLSDANQCINPDFGLNPMTLPVVPNEI